MMAQNNYSILVDNQSAVPVTLFLHKNWNHRKFLSISKIVEPGKNYFHTNEKAFRFELSARIDGRRMSTLYSLRKCEEEMVLRIRGDDQLYVKKEKLKHEEKRICLRRENMNEDVSASGNKNLYEILGLNMKEVRKKPFEEQNEMIKKAYRSKLLRWHPDKNPEHGDNAICQEIILAYKILKDPEARAAYNNVADYDKGWFFSSARWKALFKPESYRKGEENPYKRRWNGKRIGLSLLSFLLTAGGFGLTFLTAGMAAPAVLGIMAASGALMGGGISSLSRITNRESVENGCSVKKYFISMAIGAVGGVALGTGVAGIAAFFGGAAKLAFKVAQASLERQIAMRMVGNVFRSIVNSATGSLEAILAGGQKTTLKNFIVHVLINAIIGGIAGAPGGLAENMLENGVSLEEAGAAFETVSTTSSDTVEDLTRITVESFTTEVVERLDDDVENKPFGDRLMNCCKKVALAARKRLAVNSLKGTIKKVKSSAEEAQESKQNEENDDEIEKDTRNVKQTAGVEGMKTNGEKDSTGASGGNIDNTGASGGNIDSTGTSGGNIDSTEASDDVSEEGDYYDNETKEDEMDENEENCDKNTCTDGNCSSDESDEKLVQVAQPNLVPKYPKPMKRKLKYKSGEKWISKMIVDYNVNGKEEHEEGKGSGSLIWLPDNATNIRVRFQVMRFPGVWCDVKEYDRFEKCWIKPTKPHIFKYVKPVSCTYTLAGNLYYEAVMNIVVDYNDSVNENLPSYNDLIAETNDESTPTKPMEPTN